MPHASPITASVIDLAGDVFFTSQTPQELITLYSAYAPDNPASHLQRYAPQLPPSPSSPSIPHSSTRPLPPRYSLATCSGIINDTQRYYVFGLPTDPDVAWLRRQGWIVYDARWLVHSLTHGRALPLAHWIISDAYLQQPIFLPPRPETSQTWSSPATLVNPSSADVGLPSSSTTTIVFEPPSPQSPLAPKRLSCQQEFVTRPAVWRVEGPLESSPIGHGPARNKRKKVEEASSDGIELGGYDTNQTTSPSTPRSVSTSPHHTKPAPTAPKRRKLRPFVIVPSSPTPSASSTTATLYSPKVIPIRLPKPGPLTKLVPPRARCKTRKLQTGGRPKPSVPASPDVFSAPPSTPPKEKESKAKARRLTASWSEDPGWVETQEGQEEGRDGEQVPCFGYEDIVRMLEKGNRARRMADQLYGMVV
ncbi:hypothetical protein IAR50_002789 [Cryptococcus sp. DSM 104548]